MAEAPEMEEEEVLGGRMDGDGFATMMKKKRPRTEQVSPRVSPVNTMTDFFFLHLYQ
jgi:hypothetical protein